jgi:hypothetical protein
LGEHAAAVRILDLSKLFERFAACAHAIELSL